MNNAIHQNQILPLVNEIDDILLFIAPLFILNRQGLKVNTTKYKQSNIFHIRIPFFSYNFLLNIFILPLVILFALPILTYFIFKYNITVIHARNHVSALLALLAKKFSPSLFVLGDLRGHYPEEGVIVGRWKYDSITFRVWKRIEKFICQNLDKVSTISKRMKAYYEGVYDISNVVYVPAIVDVDKINFDVKLRNKFRAEHKIAEDEIVYIYVGSLGHWHCLNLFFKMLENHLLENEILKYRVFILSSVKKHGFEHFFEKHNVKITTVSASEVNEFLCGSDIGILPGSDKLGPEYELLYKTMISSKVEEYLCSGLAVIVNKRIEEVEELLEKEFPDSNGPVKLDNSRRLERALYFQSSFNSLKIKEQYEGIYGKTND